MKIFDFLEKQQKEFNGDDHVIYYQYTSLETLKKILAIENSQNERASFNLRLYNSEYMNDPDEGAFLLEKIKEVETESLKKSSDNNSLLEKLKKIEQEIKNFKKDKDDGEKILEELGSLEDALTTSESFPDKEVCLKKIEEIQKKISNFKDLNEEKFTLDKFKRLREEIDEQIENSKKSIADDKTLMKKLKELENSQQLHEQKYVLGCLEAIKKDVKAQKKRFITELYDEDVAFSKVFLASLSKECPNDAESMPLWNSYANDHQGVSLGLRIQRVELPKNDKEGMLQERQKEKLPLDFFAISYDEQKCQELAEEIVQIIQKLSSDAKENIEVRKFCKLQIDQVRFLFKRELYKYEAEVRILKSIKDYSDAKFENGSPKLFIEIPSNSSELQKQSDKEKEEPLRIDLQSIMFGCRSDRLRDWGPIIRRQFKDQPIKLSQSKFRYYKK